MKTTILLSAILAGCHHAFVVAFSPAFVPQRRAALVVIKAGGFEWEDPGEVFDQGVENPFKNPDLMKGEEGMKIDPARLLGPRLNGSNLYLVGMMGTGVFNMLILSWRKREKGTDETLDLLRVSELDSDFLDLYSSFAGKSTVGNIVARRE